MKTDVQISELRSANTAQEPRTLQKFQFDSSTPSTQPNKYGGARNLTRADMGSGIAMSLDDDDGGVFD